MATKSGPPGQDEPGSGEITRGLQALREGDAGALERLVPLLYDDLRRLARQRLRGERPGHTLDTTALVHEAYLRLATQRQLAPADRAEFFAAASNTMRRILVDYARARRRQKRGGGQTPLSVDDVEPLLSEPAISETLALDEALDRLEAAEPRAARVFEQRFFGGLSVEEIADARGVSTKTIQRDWEVARAWLRKEVRLSLGEAKDGCPDDAG
jgi:RNA polymerase sigma factor (TIGR02999 family)